MNDKQEELADQLDEYAMYLELDRQENRAHAYTNAARTIRTAPYLPPNTADLDGIGETIRTVIAEYQQTGEMGELEELKEKHDYFEELKEVDHIGPARARALHNKLRVETINDLILRGDDIQLLDGIGPKTQAKIMHSARELN